MPLLPKEPDVVVEEKPPRGLFGHRKNKASTASNNNNHKHASAAADSRNDGAAWLGKTSAYPSPETTAVSHDSSGNTKSAGTSGVTGLFHDTRQVKVVIHQFGDVSKEVCVIEQDDMPEPESPNHVVIKVQAASVTLQDCLFRRGHCFDVVSPTTLPMTPGHDMVGKILVVGTNVKEFKEGDRVAALLRTGGNARYANVLASHLVRVPATVDAAEAACMVSVYTAAYQSMKMVTSQGPTFSLTGKKILIIGGMEGVGQALVQMCNKARAEVFATCPERRHAYMTSTLGATPLPQDSKEWLPLVQGKMDVVFDGLCEDGLDAACKALAPKGEVVCFGHAAMITEPMGVFGAPMSAIINKWRSQLTRAKTMDIWESFNQDPEQYKKHLASLFQLLKWNKLRPHIAKRVGLSEVAFAHSKLETGEVRGNVVCIPWKRVGSQHISSNPGEERE